MEKGPVVGSELAGPLSTTDEPWRGFLGPETCAGFPQGGHAFANLCTGIPSLAQHRDSKFDYSRKKKLKTQGAKGITATSRLQKLEGGCFDHIHLRDAIASYQWRYTNNHPPPLSKI